MVLFNRSWYNRAGVERVMGFCTHAQYEDFMTSVVDLEALLIRSGITIVKYYLDIDRERTKKTAESSPGQSFETMENEPDRRAARRRSGTTTAKPATRCSHGRIRYCRRGSWSAPATSARRGSTSSATFSTRLKYPDADETTFDAEPQYRLRV